MSLPNQMFDHMLNPAKGWPSMAALDYQARASAAVLYDMRAGQVAHLNLSGELEPGVDCAQMGLFLFQGVNDLDVNPQGNDQWTPISPSGRIMCLVAKGPYELETTEADFTQVYFPNDPLGAPTGNTSGDELVSGVLTNSGITVYVDAVCGVVSRGTFKNAYRKEVLAFWPVWLPIACAPIS